MYYGLTDVLFWGHALLFLVAISISWFMPGFIFTRSLKFNSALTRFVIIVVSGIALWGIQGYIFGYLSIRWVTYLYLFGAICMTFKQRHELYRFFVQTRREYKNISILCLLIIIVGSIGQLVPIVGSGLGDGGSARFFGNSAYDGLLHLAYIQGIVSQFPPVEPGAAGIALQNYHYWTDLVLADLVRIWHVPVANLFFQFIPFVIAPLTGFVAYSLVKELKGSTTMAFWFLFLLYFGAGAGYVITLILHTSMSFHLPAIDIGILQFLNMPNVFGKLVFLASLIAFVTWVRSRAFRWGLVAIFLQATLFGFKVYFGIFVVIGFAFVLLGRLIISVAKQRRNGALQDATLFVLFGVLSAIIYLPTNLGAGGLIFVYLEWPRQLLSRGNLDWQDWWLRRQIYVQAGNLRNLIILDAISVAITVIVIHGTRLIGFMFTKKLLKFLGWEISLFLIPGVIIFHVLGLFSYQASGGLNVFNFFTVALVALSLFAAFILASLKRSIAIVIWPIFVILTLPHSLYEVGINVVRYSSVDHREVTRGQYDAFQYIRNNTDAGDVVQGHPSNSWNLATTSLPYFANRISYVSGKNILVTHNLPVEERYKNLHRIFQSNNIVEFKSALEELGISYVYLENNSEEELEFSIDENILPIIFENEEAMVVKIKTHE